MASAAARVHSGGGPGTIQFAVSGISFSEAIGSATITVTRSSDGNGPATAHYSTRNATAMGDYGSGPANYDYNGANGTVTFAQDEYTKTITIPIVDDALNEDNETFFIDLTSDGSGTSVGSPSTITVTILDNDPLPGISINDVSVNEGNSGTTSFAFTVTLSAPSGRNVQVDYGTADNTAAQGSDYNGTTGTLVFPGGVTTQTVTVQVKGDIVFEANETFFVTLSNSYNSTISNTFGIGTILNDDLPPLVSLGNAAAVLEGSGSAFTVKLSALSAVDVVVNYTCADGTAKAGQDYVASNGTLTIPAFHLTGTISIPTIDDAVYEGPTPENFYVVITSQSATVTQGQGIGSVNDNDLPPTISISNPLPVNEGNSGTTNVQFVVMLSNASYEPISVSYSTANGTAIAGTDYVTTSGTVTIPAGATTANIIVPVIGNTVVDGNRTFYVNLTDTPSDALLGTTQATETILNDDVAISSISIAGISLTETNKGYVDAVLNVTLSAASASSASVKYATVDGTAKAGTDYLAANGTLTFAPGVTTLPITVKVNGDRKTETNETFSVVLSTPVNATIAGSTGVVTIVNDDGLPKLWISSERVQEGNTGTRPMTFSVRLQKKASSAVSVDYTTVDGTAIAGSDFTAISGRLTFAAGETEKTITVSILGDLLYEPDEAFSVRLSNPAGAKIQDGTGCGTIDNDDARPVLSVNNVSVMEGNSGTVPAVFTVKLSGPSSEKITVNYATENGTASAPSDFAATSGTLSFNPGETSKSVTVLVNGDLVAEKDESFVVRLSKADNACIGDATGTGVIQNDDVSVIASRIDDLINYIKGLPGDAFRKPSDKNRAALIDELNEANCAFQKGNNKAAQSELKDVLCMISATNNSGTIAQDAVRQDLSPRVLDLVTALDQAVSLSMDLAEAVEQTEDVETPVEFGLAQNYPNPFNPTTTIQYSLHEPSMVTLKVYDMVGREVASLVEAYQGAGRHSVQFNGAHLTSGTYIYRIQAGSFRDVKKLVLVK